MSIGRITAAAASGTVDTTFALANINFDFSLFKITAPKEFEGVGSTLSPNRRKEAEDGRAHVTARKLAALFDSLLPACPELVKAYGKRTSEISQSQNSKCKAHSDGIFMYQAGADGTSIWAAATSGQNAIKAHLLACMLARIWNSSEATSIWVEIVKERKQRVLKEFDETNTISFPTHMAAQQELSRTQLAEWDASARSWLRTADRVKNLQQTQFEVIIRNVTGPVNTKPRVYDSVMQAWTTALRGVECLIKGMPLQTQTGEVLLGLSSWHIYPDLLILGTSSTDVHQHDPLVGNGGILTIGLQTADLQTADLARDTGVYWSLPLAHLRYYGDPVISSRSIAMDGSRLTIDDLLQVVLGSVIGGMSGADLVKPEVITVYAEWLVNLSQKVSEAFLAVPDRPFPITYFHNTWLYKLSGAAEMFLQSKEPNRQRYVNLINQGNKFSTNLLSTPHAPHFGLSEYRRYFRLIRKTEGKIKELRRLASRLGLESKDVFIRYRHECQDCSHPIFEYTTALPQLRHTVKRTWDAEEKTVLRHIRWIHKNPLTEDSHPSQRHQEIDLWTPEWENEPYYGILDEEKHAPTTHGGSCKEFESRRSALADIGEEVYPLEDQELKCSDEPTGLKIHWRRIPSDTLDDTEFTRDSLDDTPTKFTRDSFDMPSLNPRFICLFGQTYGAELFIRGHDSMSSLFREAHQKIPLHADVFDMAELFSGDNVCMRQFMKEAGDSLKEANKGYLRSLRAVASIANIYKLLPHATISIRLLLQKTIEARWLSLEGSKEMSQITVDPHKVYRDDAQRTLEYLKPYELTRAQAFACICLQESGEINLQPEKFSDVMALSTGDSIYVAASLLCDPSDMPAGQEIRRIMGNVGRPGIALLRAPPNPRIKIPELKCWDLVNNREFDGNMKDCFGDTSLHFSFTGFSLPVDIGVLGGQDSEVILLESVVSVHERGKWVADLDILQAMEDGLLRRLLSTNCSHAGKGQPLTNLTSVENWTEFLERPKRETIFKAQGNWQARLAAATIAVIQGTTTYVLPQMVCWECMKSCVNFLPSDLPFTIIC